MDCPGIAAKRKPHFFLTHEIVQLIFLPKFLSFRNILWFKVYESLMGYLNKNVFMEWEGFSKLHKQALKKIVTFFFIILFFFGSDFILLID